MEDEQDPALAQDRAAQRRAIRRGELLSAAMAVIRRDGPGATMEEMASAGGISKPILYRHFHDRSGLVSAITDSALHELGEIVAERVGAAASRDGIRATIDAVFEWIEGDPELFRFLVDRATTSGDGTTAEFIQTMSLIVQGGVADALAAAGRDAGPAEVWGRAFVGAVVVTASWWNAESQLPRDQVVDQLAILTWSGLAGTGRPAVR